MQDARSIARDPGAFVPLRLTQSSLGTKAAVVLLGTLVLAASSWIEVPMVPVPMTMQTYAVILVGALCGWRLGSVTVLAWLAEAIIGLPVLAGGAAGPVHFIGPTAGYLFAFPLAAALVGWLAERGWTTHVVPSFVAMLLGHAVCLGLGAAWLAGQIGLEQALALGLMPFLFGSVLKSGLAVVSVEIARRARRSETTPPPR